MVNSAVSCVFWPSVCHFSGDESVVRRGLLVEVLVCLVGMLGTGLLIDVSEAQPRRRTNPAPGQAVPGPQGPTPAEQAVTTEIDAEHRAVDEANQRGDYPEVVKLASILIAKDAKDYFALHLRATAKIELGRQSRDTKSVREGVADSRVALAIAGKTSPWLFVPYLYGMTSLAELEGRPEHAQVGIQIVTPVLALPNLSPADKANLYYQRGLAYFAKRELESALKDFEAATKEVSSHVGALVKSGEALAALGRPDEALKAYDKAVEAAPKNVVVHNDRGAFRRFRGDLEGAVADFSKSLELDPNFAMGYLNRGITLFDLGEYEGAESDYAKALEMKVQPPLVHRLRGNARVARGQLPAGIEDFSAALAILPAYAGALEDRGTARFAAKDFAGAAADFAESLKQDKTQAHVYLWLWLAQSRAGDAQAAAALDPVLTNAIASPEWVHKLAEFLKGTLDEAGLRAAVKSGPEAGLEARTCEAEFFVGQKKQIAGDATAALENYKLAVATEAILMAAYRVARYETGELKPAP
jgi:lipoprotein NlpI